MRPMGGAQSGLPYPGVQPKIAHQLLRAVEPADVADRRHDAGSDRQVDAGDRHQSVDRGIVDGVLRDLAVEQGQIFRQPSSSRTCRSIAARSSSVSANFPAPFAFECSDA
ncbi:hypothetical protein [Bradyrhizobium sp. 131]|uniref:hypothetical protein n=1 Tax=Bradyrhizobium sp. 131 TaxID=2782609 RepID=UPI0020002174|nr:hypothetical protein [Bradyrhizobium sp. 131]